MIRPKYRIMWNIKRLVFYRENILISTKWFDASVDQHNLFYFVKISHDLIVLIYVAQITYCLIDLHKIFFLQNFDLKKKNWRLCRPRQ